MGYTITMRLMCKRNCPDKTRVKINNPETINILKKHPKYFTLQRESKLFAYFIFDGDISATSTCYDLIMIGEQL